MRRKGQCRRNQHPVKTRCRRRAAAAPAAGDPPAPRAAVSSGCIGPSRLRVRRLSSSSVAAIMSSTSRPASTVSGKAAKTSSWRLSRSHAVSAIWSTRRPASAKASGSRSHSASSRARRPSVKRLPSLCQGVSAVTLVAVMIGTASIAAGHPRPCRALWRCAAILGKAQRAGSDRLAGQPCGGG